MSHRDFAFVAVGRFLSVECYRESHQPSSTYPLQSSGADRTAGNASTPVSSRARSGFRAPARPRQG
jgi:hypothetical protein